ncbi:MAG TPA: NAD kinase, partial [Bacteroidales bacterium]|nr:NAD kinase [Bacteroidales bacterium]
WTVAPIAPHNLNVRPMIVPDDVSLEMSANSRSGKVILCLDSREFILPSGSPVKIKKADFPLKYISLQEGSFINALKDKLRWGEDKRNIQSL